jgi:hypothetical protein
LDWGYNAMSSTTVTPNPPTQATVTPPVSQRVNQANLYRPVGPKQIAIGLNAAPGQYIQLSQQVDLSLPIRGLRFSYKGRVVVGTTGVTTPSIEGFLNLISNITIQGTNARQKGNITLWNIDLATLYGYLHLVSSDKAAYYSINAQAAAGETQLASPSTPYAFGTTAQNTYNPTGTTGTYDYRIVIDVPFFPFASQAFGEHPFWVPAFLVRNEEWKDSLQIQVTMPAVTNGAVAGPLGTPASGTTFVFTAYGSGSGNPTLDIYSLPVIMGLDLKDQVLPGVLSRVVTPINTVLQSAGNAVTLLNMQKQPTTRVFIKNGTGTAPPAFSTLLDTNITSIGILLGANRNVRNVVDTFAHKALAYDDYQRNMIQGYMELDFMDDGNPDSAYPGQNIGDGSTFQLTANVAGTANAQGIILQEQVLHTPTGALYTF